MNKPKIRIILADDQALFSVMDVRMPIMDGVEAAGILRQCYPKMKIVMLTTFPDDEYVHEALRIGANGYLLKDISINFLVKSLEGVAEGAILLSPDVTKCLAASPYDTKVDKDYHLIAELTRREIEILHKIAQGYGNHEIEENFNLGKQTVRNYISSIYSKIGAKDRFEAMKIGIESGLLQNNYK
jgi:DNA-binding NarL/FixJ family response regulator